MSDVWCIFQDICSSRHFNLVFDNGRILVRPLFKKVQCSNRSLLSCESSGQMEWILKCGCKPLKWNPSRVSSCRVKKWVALGLPRMEFISVTWMDCRYACLDGSEKRSVYNGGKHNIGGLELHPAVNSGRYLPEPWKCQLSGPNHKLWRYWWTAAAIDHQE